MTAPASSSSATQQLLRLGQSTWLDYISRGLISSGELARMIADGDVGEVPALLGSRRHPVRVRHRHTSVGVSTREVNTAEGRRSALTATGSG